MNDEANGYRCTRVIFVKCMAILYPGYRTRTEGHRNILRRGFGPFIFARVYSEFSPLSLTHLDIYAQALDTYIRMLYVSPVTQTSTHMEDNKIPTRWVRMETVVGADKGTLFEAIAVYSSASYWTVPLFLTGFCSFHRLCRRKVVLSQE